MVVLIQTVQQTDNHINGFVPFMLCGEIETQAKDILEYKLLLLSKRAILVKSHVSDLQSRFELNANTASACVQTSYDNANTSVFLKISMFTVSIIHSKHRYLDIVLTVI